MENILINKFMRKYKNFYEMKIQMHRKNTELRFCYRRKQQIKEWQ